MGKVLSKYDMDINADPAEIKSQQPYRTSPRKCRLIKEAIDSLKDLDVIQPSSSKVASSIIVVIQKGSQDSALICEKSIRKQKQTDMLCLVRTPFSAH